MRQNSAQEKHCDEPFQSRQVHWSRSKWTLWISYAIVFFNDYSLICSRLAKLNKVHCMTICWLGPQLFFLQGWWGVPISTPLPLRHWGICYFEVGVIRLMRSGGRDVRKAELTRLHILCLEWHGLVEHLSRKNTNTHSCSWRYHSGD